MTATVIGGFGLTVRINASGMTAIAQLIEGEIPEFEKVVAEITPHSAPSGYATYVATGKKKMNEMKMTLGWDTDDATHAAIVTALGSTSPVTFTVITPTGDEAFSFSAQVTKVGRIAEQEDGYKCEVTIQPTGAPTQAAVYTFTGRNGAGAITLTGAVVDDIVVSLERVSGTYSGTLSTDFEQVITVGNQIQQAAVGNLTGVTFRVKLMPTGT